MRLVLWTALLLIATSAALSGEGRRLQPQNGCVAILVPIAKEQSWRDDAYLAAVPASLKVGNGEPLILAVDQAEPWRPEVLDFLKRLQPTEVFWVGEAAPTKCPLDTLPTFQHLEAANSAAAALKLLELGWTQSKRIVAFDTANREAALIASALAGRLAEPLLPLDGAQLSPNWQKALQSIGCTDVLWVGAQKAPKLNDLKVEQLSGGIAAVKWMMRQGLAVDYLAAVNPNQTSAARAHHLALVAPLLAVARNGAVASLAFETEWKKQFAAEEVLDEQPKGAASSSTEIRRGWIDIGKRKSSFITGKDAAGKWWMQLDRNRDKRYRGKAELPVRSGEDLEIDGKTWTVNLDVNEKARGQSVWLTYPSANEIHQSLNQYLKAAKLQPRYLCLVGWPQALPMAVIGDAVGIDADLVSDLPFSQTDADPFSELAFARFIAEDIPSATLLACRGFAIDDFPQQEWKHKFATAEWESACLPGLQELGLKHSGHHPGGEPFTEESPLTNAGLIVHGSHAMWTVMGETYHWNSPTLLAPALVESAGCSTASLDQDNEHRSVAAQLLRNGAVAFVGNTRRGVAQQEYFRSEFLNAVLRGETIGEAQRSALNCLLIAVLEKGEHKSGLHYYQYYNHVVYGDPALRLDLHSDGVAKPLVSQVGSKVTVTSPSEWHRLEYTPLEEWGCKFPKLYTWRGIGSAVECSWFNPEKRNQDLIYINVEARTRRKLNTVKPLSEVASGLGWSGQCFVDEHDDGSRSLHWRVRMLDGDMTTGEIRASIEKLEFRLIAD